MKLPKNMDDFFANLVEMHQDLNPYPTTKKSGWGGVATAGLGILGNIISTSMTNRANREMQAAANAQNERLWREQMAYNSPASQIARFKQAGLNPNLAYGDNGNAGAPPEYVSSKNQSPQFDPMAIANAMLLRTEMDANESQVSLNDALARKSNSEAEHQEILNTDTRNKISRDIEQFGLDRDEQRKRIDILGENLRGLKFDNDLEQELRDVTVSMRELGLISGYFDVGETFARIQSLYQGINESIKRGELIDEQKLTEIAKREGIELDNLIKLGENGKRITMASLVLKSINGEPLTSKEEDALLDWLETEYDERKYAWQIPFYSGLNGLLIQDDILTQLKNRDEKRKQEKTIKTEQKQMEKGLKEYDGKKWRRYPSMDRKRLKLLLNLL